MKKKNALMKAVAFVAATVACLSAFSGCGGTAVGPGGGNDNGSGKTKVKVSIFGGGFGSDWAVQMINDYNKASTGKYEFVKIQDYLDDNATITSKILAGVTQADIFFTDQSDIMTLMLSGKLLDLKDVWNATPDGDNKQVREKIYANDVMEKLWSDESGTYALPYTIGVSTTVYDYDLFEDAGWFIADETTENGRSKGVDGIEGTYDDGLPATEEEYADLISAIKDAKMIPYTFMGAVAGGACEHLFESIHAQYEGLESYMTSFTYDGNMYMPSTGETQAITPQTGWKVFTESEGRDAAVDFIMEHVLKDGYMDAGSKNSSHTEAEERFLFSHNSGLTQIAMHPNGCWWENEARTAFDADARRHGAQYGFGKRKFGIMPNPIITGQNPASNGKAYYSVNSFGSVFALKSNDAEKNAAIIDFLTYFTSNKGLSTFTEKVGVVPAYNFDLSETSYNKLSFYGKTYYDMMSADNTVIVMPSVYKYLSPLNYVSRNSPSRLSMTIDKYAYSYLINAYYAGKTADKMKAAIKSAWTEDAWNKLVAEVM